MNNYSNFIILIILFVLLEKRHNNTYNNIETTLHI